MSTKKVIKLNESQLNRIIKESVKRILNEAYDNNEYYWVFSMEWDEDTPKIDFVPRYILHAYPHVTLEEFEKIKEDTYNYSPYDYVDFNDYDNEDEWKKDINYLISKGACLE